MTTYKLTGKTYPECFQSSIESHKFKTEMQGINNEVTVEINDENIVSCIIKSEHEWNPHELLSHAELLVQNTLNTIAFVSGNISEVFFNHIECAEKEVNLNLAKDYEGLIASGAPPNFLEMSFEILQCCSSEYGWHLSRSLNEFRLALRHSLDGGFYCYRSIECLRVYCKYRFNLKKEKVQWEKLRVISGVDKTEIDKIKVFADPNRHGDFQGISSEDRINIIHSTRNIIDSFFKGVFNEDAAHA